MTTTPIIFPEWTPPDVARCVRDEILDGAKIGFHEPSAVEGTLRRLVTDDRMRSVWEELRRHATATCPHNQERAALGKAARSPEEMLGSFFMSMWFNTVWQWRAITKADVNELRDNWGRARDQLSRAALFLEQALTSIEGLRMDAYLLLSREEEVRTHADNAGAAANFCYKVADMISRHAALSPLVVDRDFGNSRERGYANSLTWYTRKYFGKALCGTVATIANVALDPKIPITKKQVENWCRPNKDD